MKEEIKIKGEVMKQRIPRILKKETYSFAHSGCRNCLKRNECIRGSMFSMPIRKIFLNILGYREKMPKIVEEGIKIHKDYFSNLKTLNQYGIKEFFKDLYSGKEIQLKEVGICSKKWGLRGHIDALSIIYHKNSYNFKVIELKPKYNKEHLFQLASYCLILSDYLCSIIYAKSFIKKNKKKMILMCKRLYPQNKAIVVNITAKFLYYRDKKSYESMWIEDNEMKPFLQVIFRRSKEIRKFMRTGIFYLSELPECEWCSMFPCSFKDICERYPYSKITQRFLGKSKMLIKTKPKIS